MSLKCHCCPGVPGVCVYVLWKLECVFCRPCGVPPPRSLRVRQLTNQLAAQDQLLRRREGELKRARRVTTAMQRRVKRLRADAARVCSAAEALLLSLGHSGEDIPGSVRDFLGTVLVGACVDSDPEGGEKGASE